MANGINIFTSYEAKKLVNTYGSNTSPVYINAGVPTILTTIGSEEQPIWIDNGIIKNTSYLLKATVNNGVANRITYYSNDRILNPGSIITDGNYLRNIGGYNNTSYALSASSAIINSWIRTTGSSGWYNETYAGGWYMEDSTWIRSYNSKPLYINTNTHNVYGIGGHRLSQGWNAASHNSVLLMGGGVAYGWCVNSDGNWYYGKRTSGSMSNTSGDAYLYYGSTNGILPYNNNSRTLGDSNHRWSAIYTYSINAASRGTFTNGIDVYTQGAGANGYTDSGSGIQIREVATVTTGQSAWSYAPKIGFHWGGRYQGTLGLHSNGQFYFGLSGGTSNVTVNTGSLYATGYLYSTANSRTVQIGCQNSSWCHFTGAPQYYFDNALRAVSSIGVYNTNTYMDSSDVHAARYVYCSYVNESCGTEAPSTSSNWIFANSDGWLRKSTNANVGEALSNQFLHYNGWWTSGSGQNLDNAIGMVFAYNNHGHPSIWGIVSTFDYGYNSPYRLQLAGDGYYNHFWFRNRSADRGGWYTGWKRCWEVGEAITNAVWNDLAEYRISNLHTPGYVITPSGERASKRLEPGCRIISDTWGFALGNESNKEKMPVAISGRVLAYPARPRKEYQLGDCVCSAPDGKVDIMTRQEIRDWPDCILGIVNEIPDYEEWGPDSAADDERKKIKVNGRIWIDIK